jgi:signal transduction histidine kinase
MYFKDMSMLYAGILTAAAWIATLIVYYLTFVKKILTFEFSKFFIPIMGAIMVIIIVYISGGYTGPVAPGMIVIGAVCARIFNEKTTIKLTVFFVVIYIMFFLLEETGMITSYPMKDPLTIKYSRAIINVLLFIIIGLLAVDMSKDARDSIRFYKLRSERLTKIRKRLEFMVDKRTAELNRSNQRLKKAQAELEKNYRELKKLDKKKDEFISIASHELQTPMASMHGFSQLLQDKKVFKDKEKRKKYLKIIENETTRLSKMVKNMLNLSRIDMGTLSFDVEDVDVNEFLEEIQLQMEHTAKEKRLKLIVETNEKLSKMRVDKEKLRQILINLITNSIKYTEKGSITVSAEQQDDSIKFTVADTGIGIPKSKHEKIFERFYQVESPFTRKVLGAGLGLSIVKEFVDVMDGKIWLKSKVGKGSTFYFILPIKFTPPKPKRLGQPETKTKKRSKTK